MAYGLDQLMMFFLNKGQRDEDQKRRDEELRLQREQDKLRLLLSSRQYAGPGGPIDPQSAEFLRQQGFGAAVQPAMTSIGPEVGQYVWGQTADEARQAAREEQMAAARKEAAAGVIWARSTSPNQRVRDQILPFLKGTSYEQQLEVRPPAVGYGVLSGGAGLSAGGTYRVPTSEETRALKTQDNQDFLLNRNMTNAQKQDAFLSGQVPQTRMNALAAGVNYGDTPSGVAEENSVWNQRNAAGIDKQMKYLAEQDRLLQARAKLVNQLRAPLAVSNKVQRDVIAYRQANMKEMPDEMQNALYDKYWAEAGMDPGARPNEPAGEVDPYAAYLRRK